MITVLGSINLDLIARAERLPQPGETLTGSSFATASGGKGANQALAALKAGAPMHMVGAVGGDAFAEQALAELRKHKADLRKVVTLGDTTGVALITVSSDGENVIIVIPGANGLIDAEHARAAVADLTKGDILLLQLEIPADTVRVALEMARANNITSILNVAPFTPAAKELAPFADIVIANETEFAALSGHDIEMDMLAEQAKHYAQVQRQILIITLGAKGVLAATPEGQIHHIEAMPITPVDTVGAGDTFCGYLAASLDAGMPLEKALQRAAVAGSLACLKPGAQPAIPSADAVDAALRNMR